MGSVKDALQDLQTSYQRYYMLLLTERNQKTGALGGDAPTFAEVMNVQRRRSKGRRKTKSRSRKGTGDDKVHKKRISPPPSLSDSSRPPTYESRESSYESPESSDDDDQGGIVDVEKKLMNDKNEIDLLKDFDLYEGYGPSSFSSSSSQ